MVVCWKTGSSLGLLASMASGFRLEVLTALEGRFSRSVDRTV